VAPARVCPSHRAVRLWWNRRHEVHGPSSARPAVEAPRSWRRPRRARPRSPVQPPAERHAQIGLHFPLHALRISPVWVLSARRGTQSTHIELTCEYSARISLKAEPSGG
jgi:hypothetical protein